MSNFSDRPFVAGSLIGLRSFAVDTLGRLTGPSMGQVFTPAENVAECRKQESMYFSGGMLSSTYWRMSLTSSYEDAFRSSLGLPPAATVAASHTPKKYMPACPCTDCKAQRASGVSVAEASVEKPTPEPPPKPPHTIGGIDCACGFYAYFDGSNDYKDPARVTAIIEGYGVCTVGNRGFRASKARLVALVIPEHKRIGPKALVVRNYPDVPLFTRKRDALAAHPLTQDALPSPANEDFWTRSAQ